MMPASLAHFLQHLGIAVRKDDETTEAMQTTAKEVLNNIVTSVVINECGWERVW